MERGVSFADTVRAVLECGGAADARCWLCFGGTLSGRVPLYEPVLLERPYCPPTLPLADIVAAVVGTPHVLDSLHTHVLCIACSTAAIDAYIFREFCAHSHRLRRRAQLSLLSCDLGTLTSERPAAASAVYIVLGDERRAHVLLDKRSARYGDSPNVTRAARRATVLSSRMPCRRTIRAQWADCGQAFSRAHHLQRHAAAHNRHLACGDCGRIFQSRFKYTVHRDRAHGDKHLQCAQCPRLFASTFLLAEHVSAIHTRGECSVCGKVYNTRKGLSDHERTHTYVWVCACGRSYRYREGLRLHAKRCFSNSEPMMRKFQCSDCDKSYAFNHTLRQHVQYVHGPDPIRCGLCDKKFLTRLSLRNHMSSHTGVKRYRCEDCGETFVSSSTLGYHVRALHTGEKPFPCDECSECFITSSRRTEHKRRRHGAPAPVCTLCGARFSTPACLRRHMTKHDKECRPPPPPCLDDPAPTHSAISSLDVPPASVSELIKKNNNLYEH